MSKAAVLVFLLISFIEEGTSFGIHPNLAFGRANRCYSSKENEQTIGDLNLEEMFEVFEAADTSISGT